MSEIYRYEVPVDDQWHRIELRGEVLHVATRSVNKVELWAVHHADRLALVWDFRVYGTGHPLPADVYHVGTALTGPYVRHLMRRAAS
ncbi:hypothetical protein DEJ49_33315 [Streptomyces venezuelae]|uniref:DUF7352 domain-containing protein n=1 Tax=Streptomyces venezuelae TaxID=54571 RepID=A0A5P2CVS7_STRVZ|nr:hypothetical protein [Streptomyces venezuelae]QES45221.1 hypothetical protein DEJ49_33315 [Streptomyces venezuelae]